MASQILTHNLFFFLQTTLHFDGGCSFSDKVHDNTGEEGGGHDLKEVVKTAVPLSAPERFAGFPTMNYHVDVEICMTGDCGVPCETLAEGRTAFGRSIFPNVDLRMVSKKKVLKMT